MCGIAGIANINKVAISAMLNEISNRGPDNQGIWEATNAQLTLGHQRLAIVDLSSNGNQPMVSYSQRYVLTYNGEIYNHNILKIEVEKSNPHVRWIGSSDTEVLLAAIEVWGLDNCISKLDGMFAFALFDTQLKTLTLARDSFGEKPLFFSWINNTLAFSSQIKSLEILDHFNSELHVTSLHDYLHLGYSRGLDTFYESTYRLPAGNSIEFSYADLFTPLDKQSLKKKLRSYINHPPSIIFNKNLHAVDLVKTALEKNVSSRLLADVPVGVFLSGGIDSSLITAISQKVSQGKIQTYTIGFKQKSFDEAPYAKKIADFLKTDHHELYIEEDEVLSRIINLPHLIDEPFGDTSIIPSSFLCEFAKKNVKVALTGDGGDELFGGYSRYIIGANIAKLWEAIPDSVRKKILPFDEFLFKHRSAIIKYNLLPKSKTIKANRFLYRLLSANADALTRSFIGANSLSLSNLSRLSLDQGTYKKICKNTIVQEMMSCDQNEYLPDNILVKSDRSSMAYGLETRSPFLSASMLAISKTLNERELIHKGEGKIILKTLLHQYLPADLFDRPKTGFSPPLGDWLIGPLYSWAQELLREDHLKSLPGVDVNYTKTIWQAHCKKHIDASFALWPLLMYADWFKNRRIS